AHRGNPQLLVVLRSERSISVRSTRSWQEHMATYDHRQLGVGSCIGQHMATANSELAPASSPDGDRQLGVEAAVRRSARTQLGVAPEEGVGGFGAVGVEASAWRTARGT